MDSETAASAMLPKPPFVQNRGFVNARRTPRYCRCICLWTSFDLSIASSTKKGCAEHKTGSKMAQYQSRGGGRAECPMLYLGISPQPCLSRRER